jgi:uncharacterized membrane protein
VVVFIAVDVVVVIAVVVVIDLVVVVVVVGVVPDHSVRLTVSLGVAGEFYLTRFYKCCFHLQAYENSQKHVERQRYKRSKH